MPTPESALFLSCEHAGNRVPREYRALFSGKAALLASHRAWDPGALSVAQRLARRLGVPLLAATTTRLLVDLNRSPHNRAVFSEITRALGRDSRERLLVRYHRPHWDRVRASIRANSATTLHVAVHSFTPSWKGTSRCFAVGILYDPGRSRERAFAIDWQRRLREYLPKGDVRRNAPYRGDADGLTAALRESFSADRYLGIELELSQAVLASASERRALVAALEATLSAAAECRG